MSFWTFSEVAQVSNLLYRMASSLLRPDWIAGTSNRVLAPADWKSAIRQVGNLRYTEWKPFYCAKSKMHSTIKKTSNRGLPIPD
jgi:hypothetical protein